MLRDYQRKAINDLYQWFHEHETGNPCLVLPTGSGKSHIIAAICKEAIEAYPETKILMLTHVKELIQQNYEKLKQHWKNAPVGVYSAGLKRRCLSEPITFAGIQSIRTKAHLLGKVDLCIIDEAHWISHKDEGGYRTVINQLLEINPHMRVVGLTASPYRLGHGMIHEGENVVFNDLIEPVTIEYLVDKGYLSPLRSKHTELRLNVDGVHKRGGEYIASELNAAVDTASNNESAVKETIFRAEDRKSIIVFCTGVEHAIHVSDLFNQNGVPCKYLTGETPIDERNQIIDEFKSGKIRALTNIQVLTTGFDYPAIDCLVMLRPTMSPGLYLQMAGRGMRVAEGKDDCLVLDFAGNVSRHGPITFVAPPTKNGIGIANTKECPKCSEIVPTKIYVCPSCQHEWDKPAVPQGRPKVNFTLHNDDIMGIKPIDMEVRTWRWSVEVSKKHNKEMLRVTYYGKLSDPAVDEYFTILHDGYAGEKARLNLKNLITGANIQLSLYEHDTLYDLRKSLQNGKPPVSIKYRREGRFFNVLDRTFVPRKRLDEAA